METKKNSKIYILVIQIMLCAFGIIITVSELKTTPWSRVCIISLIMYAVALFYILYAYKVPHGNFLRYTLFIYALLLGILYNTSFVPNMARGSIIVCVALIAYMSGRLNKFDECTGVIIAVFVIVMANSVYGVVEPGKETEIPKYVTVGNKLVFFNQPLLWASMSLAYITRYKDHKNAGK